MMRFGVWTCWLALGFLAMLPTLAWASPDDDEAPGLDPSTHGDLAIVLDAGLTEIDLAPLEQQTIAAHGDIEPLLAALSQEAEAEATPETRVTAANWTKARLLIRRGNLADALTLVRELAKTHDELPVLLTKAWLLDATGRTREAFREYTRQLERIDDVELAGSIRLRLALMGKDGNQRIKESLTTFAKQEGVDDALQRRIAIVLALKGHPKEAIELFDVTGEGKARFRQEVRRAEWALAAKEWAKAREFAWNAMQAAEIGRDRRYALTMVSEAYRADDDLAALIDRFATTEDLPVEARQAWIDLLREEGKTDEALRLFREGADGTFTVEMRRELLEICRESGRDDTLVQAFKDLIEVEPARIEWRSGLSRFYLERGKLDDARAVWTSWIEDPAHEPYLITGAETLFGLGLDDVAMQTAEKAIVRGGSGRYAGLLFLHRLHKERGRLDEAEGQLARMDEMAAPDAVARAELAEAYERLGKKKQAVEVMKALQEARGPERSGEDLEMRLAWLLSEVGEEEEALDRWKTLWRRVNSVPRRRYVEDRLMAVASRLGKLADIAIDLEEKLLAGTADGRDSGLLVRLYTRANDPVSATEIIEEYMKRSGGDPVKALTEKGRVFLACTDYHNYEKTIRALIKVDPDGRGDYLRQLAMSQLERGKPDEARRVLTALRETEAGSESAEFEAGVLALAGMRDEAVAAYRKGLAAFPERIESYLLMANLLRETGKQGQAIGMFQYLAATAERDDLFTIAIDGLLNMEAPTPVVNWARRVTLERLAAREDKMYLYQLFADLAEEANDRPAILRAQEAALPTAGERRASLLRELMDLSNAGRGQGTRYMIVNGVLTPIDSGPSSSRHLTYGRRLIGLREMAPPAVYLELGEAFLKSDEVTNAARTFALAKDVPDYAAFQRQVASAFEGAGYRKHAQRTYERLLASMPGNVSLMAKVAELHEQLGRDDLAAGLYRTAMDLLFRRKPRTTFAKEEEETGRRSWWMRNRNVDEFDQYYARVLGGVLTTGDEDGGAKALLDASQGALEADLTYAKEQLARLAAEASRGEEGEAKDTKEEDEEDDEKAKAQRSLRAFPRLQSRAAYHRRLAFAFAEPARADTIDLALLEAFPEDEDLLEQLVKARVGWGFSASARRLLDDSAREVEARDKLRYLVGAGEVAETGFVEVREGSRLFLPLVAEGKTKEATALLARLDFTKLEKADLEVMPVLLSTAVQLEDGDASLRIARQWILSLVRDDKTGNSSWTVQPILGRIRSLLPKEKYRNLVEYIVGIILEDLEKAGGWLNLIPQLQRQFETPLLSSEEIDALLEKVDGNRWYWVGSFFALVPAERHGQMLRKLLPKVPPSRRMQFLMQLVTGRDEPFSARFEDELVESFAASLESLEKGQPYVWYSFSSLANGEHHHDLALRLIEAAIKQGNEVPILKSSEAVLKLKKGDTETAVPQAVEVYETTRRAPPNDFVARQANSMITANFLPDHVDAFVAALDKELADGGDALDVLERRLDLLSRAKKPDEALAAFEKAAAEFPEEKKILTRLETMQRRAGQPLAAMKTLQKLIELEPEDKALKQRLFRLWMSLDHPVKALATKRSMEEEARTSSKKPDEAAAEKEKLTVNVTDLKKAVDAGELDQARVILRRLWRTFPRDNQRRFFPGVRMGVRPLAWPRERKPVDPKAKKPRGGLDSYQEVVPKPPEARSAYDVMAEKPFGERELRRLVRNWQPAQLASGGAVVGALAHGMEERLGRDEAVKVLVRAIEAGRAGRLEYGVLLSLLEDDPADAMADARAFLRDLARTVDAKDASQIRRLARIQAALGEPEAAARLFRWSAARVSGTRPGPVMYVNGNPQIAGNSLVSEVAEALEGDLKIRTIEAILALSKPQQTPWAGPTWRDPYDAQVLNTWIEVVGPEAALERCEELITSITDLEQGLRRGAAKIATRLLARAGRTEEALRCLEIAICKLEPTDVEYEWHRSRFTNPGRLSQADFRVLFPSKPEGWQDPKGWMIAASDALTGWIDAERYPQASAFQALALLALRRHQLGDTDGARALLTRLTKAAQEGRGDILWVIDLARELGNEDDAFALERELLIKRRLHPARIEEVLLRVAAREGEDEALELGEELGAWTLREGLVKAMLQIATTSEDFDALARWETLDAQAKEARKALAPPKAGAVPGIRIR